MSDLDELIQRANTAIRTDSEWPAGGLVSEMRIAIERLRAERDVLRVLVEKRTAERDEARSWAEDYGNAHAQGRPPLPWEEQ